MNLQFMRVLGARSAGPGVLAIADGNAVRWRPGGGWSCECDTPGDTCPHVDAVAALLDDRVLTPPTTNSNTTTDF